MLIEMDKCALNELFFAFVVCINFLNFMELIFFDKMFDLLVIFYLLWFKFRSIQFIGFPNL